MQIRHAALGCLLTGVLAVSCLVPAASADERPAPPAVGAAVAPQAVADDLAAVLKGLSTQRPDAPGHAAGDPRSSTAPKTPAPPIKVSASPGDGQITVHWSPPADDGGLPVLAYRITPTPDSTPLWVRADQSSAVVSPRTNGVATTVTVSAVNLLGPGAESAPSAPVTPRHPARFALTASASGNVAYGTSSTVSATLRDASTIAQAGRKVILQARYANASGWRSVASGTTAADGSISLRAVLDGTSTLRLHHPADAVAAPDLVAGTVTVSAHVTASKSTMRLRQHQTLIVTGSVSPRPAAGAPVQLQKRTGDAWSTLASGRLDKSGRFRLGWAPSAVASYQLRVLVPASARLAASPSSAWTLTVDPENAADIAGAILRNRRITEETTHDSGVSDHATARWNIVDLAAGRLARRSAYQNAPGGSTRVNLHLLAALRAMGARMSVTVSEIAGGSHAPQSAHYDGNALDINVVNGQHVSPGSNYNAAVSICRSYGATAVYSPGYDPYGGHGNHVHCEWS